MIVESYRVLETISNVDGTLYKNDLVKFQNKEENGDWRVKDSMGRIWFINPKKLSVSPVMLSRGESK
jgi:hypothetical protein|tara:strand:+ start:839 stop:1039 length:201 start_codon:yes stop_codon:yes gene_type:complete